MPYTSTSELPEYVKRYSQKMQRQWMHVFNSTYSKIKKENGKDAESRAFKAANSVLKKRFTKKDSMSKNSRTDYFTHLVDWWLGNLNG